MKALTLHRPWTDAIAYLPEPQAKRIENRTWRPPRWIIDRHIAIHAGRTYDRDGADFIRDLLSVERYAWPVPSAEQSPTGIVATARVAGFIEPGRDGDPVGHEVDDSHEIWWVGGIGWVLDDVRPIPPLAAKGKQGLWDVPEELMPPLRARTRAVALDRLDPRPRYLRLAERAAELHALRAAPEPRLEWAQRVYRAGVRINVSPEYIATLEVDRELRVQDGELARMEGRAA